MSFVALGIVLFSALLHAFWNAMLKAFTDRAIILAAVSAAHALVGVVLISFAPIPDRASWPALFISTVVHYGYYFLLFRTYKHGELSQVYPISRGLAPALVAISAYFILNENLGNVGWAGVVAVSLGICLLAIQRGAATAPPSTIGLAVLLGVCIATYSIADGIGVRYSQAPLGYMGWLFMFEAPVALAIVCHRVRVGGRFDARIIFPGLFAGLCSVTAYGLVIYVKTIAPLGAVSAVRESSVIIATIIGLVFFGERPWRGRLIASIVVVGGIIALAFGT